MDLELLGVDVGVGAEAGVSLGLDRRLGLVTTGIALSPTMTGKEEEAAELRSSCAAVVEDELLPKLTG